jgi:hypothetical protein
MTDPRRQLAVYRLCRIDDQLKYYGDRRLEYDRAISQLGTVSGLVLALGATSAALAGASVDGQEIWAVMAAVFPAIATALAAYGALYAFEQQAKIYADAVKALRRIDDEPPDLEGAPDPATAVREYVERAEEIFRREQGQWGQLISEVHIPTGLP